MKMKPEEFKGKLKEMGYWRAIGALETAEAVSKLTPSAPLFQIAVLLSEHIPSSEILNFFGTASTSTSMSSQARPPPPPPNNKEERKEVNVNTPQRQQPVQQQQQYYWYPPYWYPPQYQPPPTNQQYQGAQSQHPQQPNVATNDKNTKKRRS